MIGPPKFAIRDTHPVEARRADPKAPSLMPCQMGCVALLSTRNSLQIWQIAIHSHLVTRDTRQFVHRNFTLL